MKRVLTAVVLIPLVLGTVFRAPMWFYAAMVGVVALLAVREYLNLVEAHGVSPLRSWVYFFFALLFLSLVSSGLISDQFRALQLHNLSSGSFDQPSPYLAHLEDLTGWLRALVTFSPLVLLAVALRRPDLKTALPASAFSAFAFLYIAFPMFGLSTIRIGNKGAFYVLYLLCIVWVGDIAAYYVGTTLGKHRLAPRISPNKSWEGAVASFVAAVLVGTLLLHHDRKVIDWLMEFNILPGKDAPFSGFAYFPMYPQLEPLWVHVGVSAVANIAAQVGDLVESAMKRGAGVKDSGSIVPGHGGVLDRIDALLFAIPVVWYYATLSATLHI